MNIMEQNKNHLNKLLQIKIKILRTKIPEKIIQKNITLYQKKSNLKQ